MSPVLFFSMVFGFVLLISGMGMFFDYKKGLLKVNAKMNDFERNALMGELANVKQRLAVLEKIITDKNYDLNEEFARLHSRE